LDIRDIRESVPDSGPYTLQDMFTLQKILIRHYIGIEGLPPYPININIKEGQDLIKDFSGRLIEELGEGFESYEIMLEMFHQGKSREDMIPHLQNFNEEISDALHFWLELMIYSDFENGRMDDWLEREFEIPLCKNSDLMKEWLKLGNLLHTLGTDSKKFPSYQVIRDKDLKDEFLRGGRDLSNERCKLIKEYLWDIVYRLQIARNTLKNKPWKQTQMMTDKKLYEEAMMIVAVNLFRFLSFIGMTSKSIFEIYWKKNKVNQFRIRSKY